MTGLSFQHEDDDKMKSDGLEMKFELARTYREERIRRRQTSATKIRRATAFDDEGEMRMSARDA